MFDQALHLLISRCCCGTWAEAASCKQRLRMEIEPNWASHTASRTSSRGRPQIVLATPLAKAGQDPMANNKRTCHWTRQQEQQQQQSKLPSFPAPSSPPPAPFDLPFYYSSRWQCTRSNGRKPIQKHICMRWWTVRHPHRQQQRLRPRLRPRPRHRLRLRLPIVAKAWLGACIALSGLKYNIEPNSKSVSGREMSPPPHAPCSLHHFVLRPKSLEIGWARDSRAFRLTFVIEMLNTIAAMREGAAF